jgi:hypothetical protein
VTTTGCFLGIRSKKGSSLRESVFSAVRPKVIYSGQLVSELVAKKGRNGTWSSAATRIVLAKDARRAVAVDTVTAELS